MLIDKIKKVVNEEKTEKNKEASDMLVGKWVKCEACKEIIYKEDLHNNLSVCPKCQKHFRLSARRRISQIVDEASFEETEIGLQTNNPIQFEGYLKKIEAIQEKTKIEEAVMTGSAKIEGHRTMLCVMDGNFLMGSMGCVVGEKITLAIEKAIEQRLPIILFCVSGGARMQEGIISLMQMAKTTQALAKHQAAGLLSICVLTDPTTGGVTASFASLGDIILAEPGALIGFAGPRVIQQTIQQELPEGFQRAEFLLEHGFIDQIVERKQMRKTLALLLQLHEKQEGGIASE